MYLTVPNLTWAMRWWSSGMALTTTRITGCWRTGELYKTSKSCSIYTYYIWGYLHAQTHVHVCTHLHSFTVVHI